MKKALLSLVSLSILIQPLSSYAQDADAALKANIDLSKDRPQRAVGQKPVEKSLEDGIWVETAKAEKEAKTSGERTSYKELENYVGQIAAKIIPEYKDDIRVYVMERPFFNAQMAPNGYSEVWTGLMLRAQTEDELAFVIGHEAGHFLHSHSIDAYEDLKKRANTALAASILIQAVAIAAAANAGSVGSAQNALDIGNGLSNIVYLGTVAGFMSYSRDKEERADIYGVHYATKAGYNKDAGVKLWEKLLAITAASDYKKVRDMPTRVNIFGSHPLEKERIDNISTYVANIKNLKAARSADEEKAARLEYRNKIRPYLEVWLKDELRREDFGQSIYIIGLLSQDGQDLGLLNFYKGEALRLRAKNDDVAKSLEAFQESLKYPDAHKDAYKKIGDLYRKNGDNQKALDAYKKYVEKNPNADDAWIIEDLISQVSKKLSTPTGA